MTATSTVDAYAAPIVEQLRRLGEPAAGATMAGESGLQGAHAKLTELHAQHTSATRTVMGSWEGTGAGEANSRAVALHGRLGTIAGDAQTALGTLRDAAGRVNAGRTEIQQLIDEFSGWAAGQVTIMQQVPEVLRPSIGAGIWARANEYAGQAGDVVRRVDGELSGFAGTLRGLADDDPASMGSLGTPLTQLAAPAVTAPATTAAAGAPAPLLSPADGTAAGPTTGGPGGSGWAGGSGSTGGAGGGGGGHAFGSNLPMVHPIPPGAGVQLQLPGDRTAEAPNEIAANAVRYALQQLGVPYVWGAASPGQGFDCSGLTSWAYEMAGMGLPRHSSDQAIGAMVPPDQLMPGDLVVWQGHVAMAIGNDMMVEAGDPVQISPVRTGNSGMNFLGFFRPTG
jgi:cell wall-associated NlpC family hydrolase